MGRRNIVQYLNRYKLGILNEYVEDFKKNLKF